MTWRIKAVHESGALEWVGPEVTFIAGLEILDRLRLGNPTGEFEEYLYQVYGPRWRLSVDHGPPAESVP